jgi:hypothetical protein
MAYTNPVGMDVSMYTQLIPILNMLTQTYSSSKGKEEAAQEPRERLKP